MNINVKIILELRRLMGILMNRLGEKLDELDLPGSSYPILTYLNSAGRVKTQELGSAVSLTSGSITHMVNRLIKQGYIQKHQDQKDKRIFWLELTEEGKKVHDKVNEEIIGPLFESFTNEEKKAFIEELVYFKNKLCRKKALNKGSLTISRLPEKNKIIIKRSKSQ